MFSIVVVCLNAEDTIVNTLDSILGQKFKDYEIVIKDGCSKDNTLSLIPKDERIHVFVKPDDSVYDAMNQAIDYVNGRYIIFMNCGDSFYDSHVLENVHSIIMDNHFDGSEVLYGDYSKNGKLYKQTPIVDRKYMINGGLCHQTVFFGEKLFSKYGKFDNKFRICADYELMTRALARGCPYMYIEIPICNYLGGGISEKEENLIQVKKEGSIVRKRYFTIYERCIYWFSKLVKPLDRKRKGGFLC